MKLFGVLFRIWCGIARLCAFRPENIGLCGSIAGDARTARIRTPDLRLSDAAVTLDTEGHLKARLVGVGGETDVEKRGKNEWHIQEDRSLLALAQHEVSRG